MRGGVWGVGGMYGDVARGGEKVCSCTPLVSQTNCTYINTHKPPSPSLSATVPSPGRIGFSSGLIFNDQEK